MLGSEALTLERITCAGAKPDSHREIISIAGMPFYQSTGHNSAYANTWFPFFGLQESNAVGAYPRGWFIKSFASDLPKNITKKMSELFPSYGGLDAGRELLLRFWNVPCLLFSSTMGGGLWASEKGAELKAFLNKEFPQFYRQMPKLQVTPSLQAMTEPEAINQWLCAKAGVVDYKKLTDKFPKTVDQFLTKVAALAKKPTKPVFRPPVPVLHNPLKELPRHVASILREQAQQTVDQTGAATLPKVTLKTTPKVTPPIKPKATPKVAAKKAAPKTAPKKPAAKKVRIVSVDTQNGKHLFEARNQLRARGLKPAPKRKDHEKPLKHFLAKNTHAKPVTVSQPKKPLSSYLLWNVLFSSIAAIVAFSVGSTLGFYVFAGFAGVNFIAHSLYVGKSQQPTSLHAPSSKTSEKTDAKATSSKVWLPSQNKAGNPVSQEPKTAPKSILKTRMGL